MRDIIERLAAAVRRDSRYPGRRGRVPGRRSTFVLPAPLTPIRAPR